jgi:NADPH-dependent curcumin reductase
MKNQQVLMQNRPQGWVKPEDFKLVETDVPAPADGQVLIKNHALSLDPYMRGRMGTGKSYVKGLEIGDVMTGEAAHTGWQTHAALPGENVRKVEPGKIPLSYFLGIVGMPGCTAYFGLTEIGQPRAGETVVVSGAAGAVGGIVGQICKMKGCRVVGIAGGKSKCDYVVNELGFDACIDYKTGNAFENLRAAAPKGIDVYWDNVGGEITDMALAQANIFARFVVCGMISQYNATDAYGMKNYRAILVNRIRMQGMIVFDWASRYPEAWNQLAEWVTSGKLKYRESVAEGLANAPAAFIGMLKGANVGKQIVRLG